MKKLIKVIVSSLFITTIFSTQVFAQAPIFTDVPADHPNATAIKFLFDKGIINGYEDGTFKPDQIVNRVEALKILLLAAQIEIANNLPAPTFSDTPADAWYAPFLTTAVNKGIVNGYEDNTYKPAQTVNLVEALKILVNSNDIKINNITRNISVAPFIDAYVDQWYNQYLWYARTANLVDVDTEGKIYPGKGLTRAKIAELIYRFLWLEDENFFHELAEEPLLISYRKEVLVDNLDPDNESYLFDFEKDQEDIIWPASEIWLGSLAINGSWTKDVNWNIINMTEKYEGKEMTRSEIFDDIKECPEDGYAYIDDEDGDGYGEPRRAHSSTVYCLKTSEENYVKIEVIDAWDENYGDDKYLKFRYIYRADGSRQLP